MQRTLSRIPIHRETIRNLTDLDLRAVRAGADWTAPLLTPYTTTRDEACSGSCCTLVTQTY